MGKFSRGSGVKIEDPEGMFLSLGQKGLAMEAHKKAMMKSTWGIKTMDSEVAEILRLCRSLDDDDWDQVKSALDEMDKQKAKKVSPPQHQEA